MDFDIEMLLSAPITGGRRVVDKFAAMIALTLGLTFGGTAFAVGAATGSRGLSIFEWRHWQLLPATC